MLTLIYPLSALLAGVALLLAGSGLLGTLLAVRGSQEGMTDATLGLIMSGYFVGFFLGTFTAPPLIRRLGHIRAFTFCSAAAAAAVLLHAVALDPLSWTLLRVVTGAALVTLYTIIESWLNAQAPNDRRGQVFATYMVINLAALAVGQQLLRIAPTEGFVLFSVVAIFICLATMPVSWTRLAQPALPAAPPYRLRRLRREAPSAATGALLSGLAMGAFWGLGPLFGARSGLDAVEVANFMTVAIIGGAALQWPLGRISDHTDRRIVIGVVAALAAVVAVVMWMLPADPNLLYIGIFVYGGLAFAIYPISVAHLMDRLHAEDVLGASSALLLLHGVGAALGPALAGAAMARFGFEALLGWFALTQGLLAFFVLVRLGQRSGETEHGVFMPMLRTTPTALEMLPENDPEHPEPEPTTDPSPPR
jgi:MFS family permease